MSDARIVIAAPGSGSGKTTLTCGILTALRRRGIRAVSCKCGPDYIDPMFHERVLGIPSENLDLFFSGPEALRQVFRRHAAGAEIAVIEGVMGYYDGLGAAVDTASTYRVAEALDAPVVLVIDARGQSLSALANLEGFLRFRPDSRIRGVIFNRMSAHVFRALRPEVIRLGVEPLGYLPRSDEFVIESRHLGLVMPGEIEELTARLTHLAETIGQTVDLDALLRLASEAGPVPGEATGPAISGNVPCDGASVPEREGTEDSAVPAETARKVRIAVARDEAFCFCYKENLRLLAEAGAELVFFSPIRDGSLPEDVQGLLLPGGYPELYAKELEANAPMRVSVAQAVRAGLPTIAECGGFLYLHEKLEDMDGVFREMAGVISADAYRTEKLGRFGYITLSAKEDSGWLPVGETIRGHEFHYYESGDCGSGLTAEKPLGGRKWDCGHVKGDLFALFPHLYFGSDPQFAARFVRRCKAYTAKPADPAMTGIGER